MNIVGNEKILIKEGRGIKLWIVTNLNSNSIFVVDTGSSFRV